MCGIAVIISGGGSGSAVRRIAAMTDAVRHRGPDDEGFLFAGDSGAVSVFGGPDTPSGALRLGTASSPLAKIAGGRIPELDFEPFLAMGHRRLSIIDLSPAGHQPMSDASGRFWIVYNGEIYNHREIRAELERAGRVFVSGSDTEVILEAYAAYGEKCQDMFNGMWAFVIYDRVGRRVFASRDRFGIKPLYYWTAPDGSLALASEIRQFAALDGWSPEADRDLVSDFLAAGVSQYDSRSFFKGVKSLPGGHSMSLEPGGRPLLKEWYDAGKNIRPFTGTFADAQKSFRELFFDSVRLQLRADVKVGSCLSGGLDSGSIVCAAARLLKESGKSAGQETFTACFHDKRYDESGYADIAAAAAGAVQRKVFPSSAGLDESLGSLVRTIEEPFGTSSIFAQSEIFREAQRHGVKVMLDGQGADETLAGYHEFFTALFKTLLRGFKWAALAREFESYRRLSVSGLRGPAAAALRTLCPSAVYGALRGAAGHGAPPWLRAEKAPPSVFRDSVLGSSLALLGSTRLPALLHFEDRNSMAHSVEARVPFLDHRLAELALGFPDSFKIGGGMTKLALRGAMTGVLPEKIINRTDKMGFVTPEKDWLAGDPEKTAEKLRAAADMSGGLVDAGLALKKFDSDVRAGKIVFGSPYWRLLCFGEWARVFNIRKTER